MEVTTQATAPDKRVLIVDDGPDNLQILSARLRGRYQLQTAADGVMALNLAIAEDRPDLILLDVMMPEMDGFEVCRRLKADERTRDIPIIFLTALTQSEDEAYGLRLGAADYISKPFAPETLYARIEAQLNRSRYLNAVREAAQHVEDNIANGISRLTTSEVARQRLHESKQAMLGLARTAFKDLSLKQLLTTALDHILSLPWLHASARGAIFLLNGKGDLHLFAHRGFSEEQEKVCHIIHTGKGVCGLTAKHRNLVYVEQSSGRCANYVDSDRMHGNYSLPLIDGDNLLGVLNVYLPDGHVPLDDEEGIMWELSEILSGVIGRLKAEERVKLKQAALQQIHIDTIRKLAMAAEYRDAETGMHTIRMSKYAALIAATAGFDQTTCDLIEQAAPMHDLGKIGIADSILLKPDRLDSDEFDVMKKHTLIGARILNGSEQLMQMARSIALYHHEKWDGSGYPHGLSGQAIPIAARICALSDVFDALTTRRPYKKSWPLEQAIEHIRSQSGKHFDPNLVRAFDRALPDIIKIGARYRDDDSALGGLGGGQGDIRSKDLFFQDNGVSTNVNHVDIYHRHLLYWINQLHHALHNDEGTVAIGKALFTLEHYVKIHFATEERMMEAYDYPYLESHARMHRAFERKLTIFKSEIMDNPLTADAEIVDFLREWLINHIRKIDTGIIDRITLANLSSKSLH